MSIAVGFDGGTAEVSVHIFAAELVRIALADQDQGTFFIGTIMLSPGMAGLRSRYIVKLSALLTFVSVL